MNEFCSSCGRRDGTHEDTCIAVRRAEEKKLQAECLHREEYGIIRKASDPPGPPQCGRCRIELVKLELLSNGDEAPVVAWIPLVAYEQHKTAAELAGERLDVYMIKIFKDAARVAAERRGNN